METISYADLSTDRPKRVRKYGGVRIIENLIPERLIKAYHTQRWEMLGASSRWLTGWPHPTSYMEVPSMLELATYPPLMQALKEEIGEDMGLHLVLTGFVSTQRKWHSDQYLNPDFVADKYLAVWIALDDIHPDSGPFEWVPGSETWPVLSHDKVFEAAGMLRYRPDWDTMWPNITEDFVAAACDEEIARRGGEIVPFLARKGDVLIWDSDLIHRGSAPKDPTKQRPSLICHYSSIHVRKDFPAHTLTKLPNGSHYWAIKTDDGRYK